MDDSRGTYVVTSMQMKVLEPELYEVESTSRPGQTYVVDARERSCTCLGFRFRGSCKHLRAVLEEEKSGFKPSDI